MVYVFVANLLNYWSVFFMTFSSLFLRKQATAQICVVSFQPRSICYQTPTGSPEAVTRPRLPQNVACGFPALRSSGVDSQHCVTLELRIRQNESGTQ